MHNLDIVFVGPPCQGISLQAQLPEHRPQCGLFDVNADCTFGNRACFLKKPLGFGHFVHQVFRFLSAGPPE